jgi:hypothetical protein
LADKKQDFIFVFAFVGEKVFDFVFEFGCVYIFLSPNNYLFTDFKKLIMFKIKKLKKLKQAHQDKIIAIHESDMDPDMKAYYLNDVEYAIYCVDDEIDFEKRMLLFTYTLYAFVAFALSLVIWAILYV